MNKRVERIEAMTGEGLGDNWIFSGERRTEMEKQKMKSEVRIFFPNGLRCLGGAWGWRRWPFYPYICGGFLLNSVVSGILEVLMERIVLYFKELLLGFSVSEPKNNYKSMFYPTFLLQKIIRKKPWTSMLYFRLHGRNRRRRSHHRFAYERRRSWRAKGLHFL